MYEHFDLRDMDFTVFCLSDIAVQFILVMLYQHSGLHKGCSLYHSHITNLTKRCHLLLEEKNRAQFLPFKTKQIFNYQIKIRIRLLFLTHLTGTNSIIISFTYNKKTIYKYVARKKNPINLKWNDISLLFSVHFKIETNVIIMKIKFELRAFISHKLKMIKRELTFSIIWGENMTDYWSPSTTLAKYYELMFAFINDIKCSYNIFHLCTGFNRSKGVTHVLSN